MLLPEKNSTCCMISLLNYGKPPRKEARDNLGMCEAVGKGELEILPRDTRELWGVKIRSLSGLR